MKSRLFKTKLYIPRTINTDYTLAARIDCSLAYFDPKMYTLKTVFSPLRFSADATK